jgi:hypothetical protein
MPMHPLFVLSLVLQIGCAVHVVRTGRPMYWIFLLLIGSYVAVAIYIFAEVLPGLRNHRTARRMVSGAQDRIDPERHKRRAAQQLDVADTLDNRRRLADESFRSGDYQQAAELYRSGLKGLYNTDPNLMLGLARSQFALNLPAEAKRTLDDLIAANPDFRSSEGHLLYARCVEASGDIQAALHEYEAVSQGFPGEEARVRYAQLLGRDGQTDKAAEVFAEVLKRARVAPGYYQREQREWIDIARRESVG